MKPVLFVDVDGTIVDSMQWWLTVYNYKNCTAFTKEQVTQWELEKCIGISLNEYFDDYKGAQEIKGAKTSLIRLQSYYDIVLTTAGSGKHWAEMHGFCYPVIHVPLRMKRLLRGYALVDDYDKNLDGFVGKQFMIDQPWNRNSGRVGMNWEQITEELINDAKNSFTDGVSIAFV